MLYVNNFAVCLSALVQGTHSLSLFLRLDQSYFLPTTLQPCSINTGHQGCTIRLRNPSYSARKGLVESIRNCDLLEKRKKVRLDGPYHPPLNSDVIVFYRARRRQRIVRRVALNINRSSSRDVSV